MSDTTNKNLPDKDEVLNNEAFLLQGLIEAANYKNDEAFHRTIQIKRGEKVLFTFTVRPLSDEEEVRCYRLATPTVKNRAGLPIDGKTDTAKVRSHKIYMATIDEDKRRIWDNQEFKKQLGVVTAVEFIDKVLRSGDKDAVVAIIDQISGTAGLQNDGVGTEGEGEQPTLEEFAKN